MSKKLLPFLLIVVLGLNGCKKDSAINTDNQTTTTSTTTTNSHTFEFTLTSVTTASITLSIRRPSTNKYIASIDQGGIVNTYTYKTTDIMAGDVVYIYVKQLGKLQTITGGLKIDGINRSSSYYTSNDGNGNSETDWQFTISF